MLNKIQERILKEYKKYGHVVAQCPRQCGKTTILAKITAEYLLNKNGYIQVITPKQTMYNNFLESVVKELLIENPNYIKILYKIKNIVKERISRYSSSVEASLIISDEENILDYLGDDNVNYACAFTPIRKTLSFSYKDMDKEYQNRVLNEIKPMMDEERFEIEFGE